MGLGERMGFGETPWAPLLLGVATGLLIGPLLRQDRRSHLPPAGRAPAATDEHLSAELNRMTSEGPITQ